MVNLFDERFVYGLTGIAFLFAATNFDRDLGLIFAGMAAILFGLFNSDKFKTIRLESKRNLGKSLVLAIGGYVSFILISLVTLPFFKQVTTSITGVNSVLEILVQTQQTLALEGFIPLQFVFFGFLVPIVETGMLALLLELFKDKFRVNVNQLNFRLISLWVGLSLIFVIFHLTAKGINNFAALYMVFLFGIITYVLIKIEGQSLSATLFHIITNSIALIILFGLAANIGTSAIFVGSGLIAFFVLTGRFNLRQLKFT